MTVERSGWAEVGARHATADAVVAALIEAGEPIGIDEVRCPDVGYAPDYMDLVGLAQLDDRIRFVTVLSGGYIQWSGFELAGERPHIDD
jgi:hypothetical protein